MLGRRIRPGHKSAASFIAYVLPLYPLHVIEGHNEGSGKPLLGVPSDEKTGRKEGGESKVSPNLKCYLYYLPSKRKIAVYINRYRYKNVINIKVCRYTKCGCIPYF